MAKLFTCILVLSLAIGSLAARVQLRYEGPFTDTRCRNKAGSPETFWSAIAADLDDATCYSTEEFINRLPTEARYGSTRTHFTNLISPTGAKGVKVNCDLSTGTFFTTAYSGVDCRKIDVVLVDNLAAPVCQVIPTSSNPTRFEAWKCNSAALAQPSLLIAALVALAAALYASGHRSRH